MRLRERLVDQVNLELGAVGRAEILKSPDAELMSRAHDHVLISVKV